MYAEFGKPVAGAPSLQDASRSSDAVRQRRTAAYLLTGTAVRSTMGMTPDVLDDQEVYLSESLISAATGAGGRTWRTTS